MYRNLIRTHVAELFSLLVLQLKEYRGPVGPHVESAIWLVVDAGLTDPDPGVRRGACTAVGCICEDAASSRHAVLVPALVHLVADTVTQCTVCSALDALLEILGDAVGNYLQLLGTVAFFVSSASSTRVTTRCRRHIFLQRIVNRR